MFTGLVEAKGALVRRTQHGRDARLVLRGDLVGPGKDPIVLGESIAVDGVCLTVAAIVEPGGPGATVFEADASSETLAKTTLGSLAPGASVNLERALPIGGRLGGHLVSGHVDGVGRVREKNPSGAALQVVFEAPAELARFIAPKGSICVSGVSLTVNGVSGSAFDVMLVPHTRDKTSLDALAVGAQVNLEVDVLARYVARLLEVGRAADPSDAGSRADDSPDSRLLDRLRAAGYV
ncbi:MAG: riboflavin synthase [Labilithrix sp.]|nr:riboflavin synthase [Labilithrix sp.]MBX3218871.1 riboflavin synthase [Labilithrix sp.]